MPSTPIDSRSSASSRGNGTPTNASSSGKLNVNSNTGGSGTVKRGVSGLGVRVKNASLSTIGESAYWGTQTNLSD
jgi:hypothetical protein